MSKLVLLGVPSIEYTLLHHQQPQACCALTSAQSGSNLSYTGAEIFSVY